MIAEMMSDVPESEVVVYLKQAGADTLAVDASGMTAKQLGDQTREKIASRQRGTGVLLGALEEKCARRYVGCGGVDTAGVVVERKSANRGYPELVL